MRNCWAAKLMELAAIIAALLAAVCAAVVLTALMLRAWYADHPSSSRAIRRMADAVVKTLDRLSGRRIGNVTTSQGPDASTLMLRLALGLVVVALAAVSTGSLVDDVTDGDGVTALDHPVANFVASRRTPPLTAIMKVVSVAGSPIGMTILALGTSLLLGFVWRWWTPLVLMAATAAGVIGLTDVFKTVLGRARPPLTQAVAAADGYGFPSGHAAAAAAICATAAWLCTVRLQSRPARIAVCAGAAMVAAIVGISRVYLGVHWTSDVIGGWAFGVLWAGVVVSCWTGLTVKQRRR